MSRYYFDVHEGASLTIDEEGRDLAGLEQAKQAAMNDARSLMCEDLGHAVLCPCCFVAISNALHERVAQVFFRDAYQIKQV